MRLGLIQLCAILSLAAASPISLDASIKSLSVRQWDGSSSSADTAGSASNSPPGSPGHSSAASAPPESPPGTPPPGPPLNPADFQTPPPTRVNTNNPPGAPRRAPRPAVPANQQGPVPLAQSDLPPPPAFFQGPVPAGFNVPPPQAPAAQFSPEVDQPIVTGRVLWDSRGFIRIFSSGRANAMQLHDIMQNSAAYGLWVGANYARVIAYARNIFPQDVGVLALGQAQAQGGLDLQRAQTPLAGGMFTVPFGIFIQTSADMSSIQRVVYGLTIVFGMSPGNFRQVQDVMQPTAEETVWATQGP